MKLQPVQILFPIILTAFGAIAWGWMVSDISGEYGASNAKMGTVTMSVVRKATTVKAELAYGMGALLECNAPYASAGQTVNWTFSTPEKWIKRGQVRNQVMFNGKIERGYVTGVLENGPRSWKIRLARNGLASIYRMLQSHMPWVG